MSKQVNTHVVFQENCEYQSSNVDRVIEIEPQAVEIDLTIINKNTNHPNDNNIYYDDLLEIQAYVFQWAGQTKKTIQVGRIDFFYQPLISDTPIPLNTETSSCILAKNGTAKIHYKPNQPGIIIARYIDENEWYADAEASSSINLQSIPVEIKFTKRPPYIVDLEDSVALEVEVNKKYPNDNNDILNYGVVTFLHYVKHFDMDDSEKRVEHVIGNPVLVRDGKASIKYIPIQEYNDLEPTDLIDGTEYIRAVYYYNNDIYYRAENEYYETINEGASYSNQWQYFKSANIYTNIEIYKPNSVLIGITDNKSVDSTGRFTYKENETIHLKAQLFDKDGQEIILPDESVKDLTFHIEGTKAILKKHYLINTQSDIEDAFDFVDYQKDEYFDDYVIEYDGDTPIHGYFIKSISNLKYGNYTIQASTRGQIIDGEFKIYTSDEDDNVIEIEYNDETHLKYDTDEIRTDEYLDSIDTSNTIYIDLGFQSTSASIAMSCSKSTIQNGETINNFISSTVTINNNYKQLLNNATCYFVSPKTGQTYIGKLSYSSQKLIGTITDDVSFSVGDYPFYMYIPAGYYKTSKDIYLDDIFSNVVKLHVRDNLTLNLDYTILSKDKIQYTISSNTIYGDTEANVTVTLKKGNNTINTKTFILSEYINQWTQTIGDLGVGSYTLTAHTTYNNYSISKSFTINPGIIQQNLQPNSKIIRATPYGTVDLVISSEDADLRNLNLNSLTVYLNKNTSQFNASTAIANHNNNGYVVKYIEEDSIYLTVNAGTYLPTQLLITAYYDGDNDIQRTTCVSESFETILIEPTVNNNYETNTAMSIRFNNGEVNNIVLIGEIEFMNEGNKIGQTQAFITSESTEFYIRDIPEECDNIKLIINPYHSALMSAINNKTVQKFTTYLVQQYHTIHECNRHLSNQSNACNIDKIVQQYNDSGKTCLFPLFKQKTINISRKIL